MDKIPKKKQIGLLFVKILLQIVQIRILDVFVWTTNKTNKTDKQFTRLSMSQEFTLPKKGVQFAAHKLYSSI